MSEQRADLVCSLCASLTVERHSNAPGPHEQYFSSNSFKRPCVFLPAERMHVHVSGRNKDHSLAFLAHKAKLNEENPLLVGSHGKYAILGRKRILPFHFSHYEKNSGYTKKWASFWNTCFVFLESSWPLLS